MIQGRLASGWRNQNLRRWEREMGQLLGNQAAAPRGIKPRAARWPGRATPGGTHTQEQGLHGHMTPGHTNWTNWGGERRNGNICQYYTRHLNVYHLS